MAASGADDERRSQREALTLSSRSDDVSSDADVDRRSQREALLQQAASLRADVAHKGFEAACAQQWDASLPHSSDEIAVLDAVTQEPLRKDDVVVLHDGQCYSRAGIAELVDSGVVNPATNRVKLPLTGLEMTPLDYVLVGREPPAAPWSGAGGARTEAYARTLAVTRAAYAALPPQEVAQARLQEAAARYEMWARGDPRGRWKREYGHQAFEDDTKADRVDWRLTEKWFAEAAQQPLDPRYRQYIFLNWAKNAARHLHWNMSHMRQHSPISTRREKEAAQEQYDTVVSAWPRVNRQHVPPKIFYRVLDGAHVDEGHNALEYDEHHRSGNLARVQKWIAKLPPRSRERILLQWVEAASDIVSDGKHAERVWNTLGEKVLPASVISALLDAPMRREPLRRCKPTNEAGCREVIVFLRRNLANVRRYHLHYGEAESRRPYIALFRQADLDNQLPPTFIKEALGLIEQSLETARERELYRAALRNTLDMQTEAYDTAILSYGDDYDDGADDTSRGPQTTALYKIIERRLAQSSATTATMPHHVTKADTAQRIADKQWEVLRRARDYVMYVDTFAALQRLFAHKYRFETVEQLAVAATDDELALSRIVERLRQAWIEHLRSTIMDAAVRYFAADELEDVLLRQTRGLDYRFRQRIDSTRVFANHVVQPAPLDENDGRTIVLAMNAHLRDRRGSTYGQDVLSPPKRRDAHTSP